MLADFFKHCSTSGFCEIMPARHAVYARDVMHEGVKSASWGGEGWLLESLLP